MALKTITLEVSEAALERVVAVAKERIESLEVGDPVRLLQSLLQYNMTAAGWLTEILLDDLNDSLVDTVCHGDKTICFQGPIGE